MKKPGTRLEVWKYIATWKIDLYIKGTSVAEKLCNQRACSWKTTAGAVAQAKRWSKALGNIPVVVDE